MKTYDKLLPDALKAVKNNKIANDKGIVYRQYNGYISSFSANVIQSGLLATVVLYSNENAHTEEERGRIHILNAIKEVLAKVYSKEYKDIENKKLYQIVLEYQNDTSKKRTLQRRILDTASALKLAIRTFKLEDKDKEKKENTN